MASTLPSLTAEEIEFFVVNGFLVKRGVLSPRLCAAARDRLWAGNTSDHLRRADPESWWGGIPEVDRKSTAAVWRGRTTTAGPKH